MGMSSSQARLLNLTARMHQIEYKAAKLEAQKLQMANESTRVYEDYLLALDSAKIQKKSLTTNGSVTYIDATYNNLINKAQDGKIYTLKYLPSNQVYLSEDYKKAWDISNKTLTGFISAVDDIKNNSEDYISITSAEQLLALSGSSGNYRLDADITLTDWTGITDFSGKFDGNGHSVTISGESGLFKIATDAIIKNTNIIANINGDLSYTGGLLDYGTNVIIKNCNATGNVTSENRIVGGLIGQLNGNCEVTNSGASVDVYSNYKSVANGDPTNPEYTSQDYFGRCGGFIGRTNRDCTITFNDCTTVGGSVNYSYWQAGGFIGQSNGDITLNRCTVDNAITVNYNGYGDDYVSEYQGMKDGQEKTYSVPSYGSTLIGLINTGTATINDCNIYGSVSGNGNKAFYGRLFGYVDGGEPLYVNNSYSLVAGSDYSPTPIEVEYTINSSDYPNLDDNEINYLVELYPAIKNSEGAIEVPDEYANSTEWLTNIINSGMAILEVQDITNNRHYDTSISTDTYLQEVPDTVLLKKAEAKYEADMKRIDLKDRKYDTDLAALDAERNAIKQEIETLKTVAMDNVERTFKLFS